MPTISITLDQAPDFFGRTMAKAIREGALAGLYSAAIKGVVEVQTRIIPALVPEPVDRGAYRAGWRAIKTREGAEIENLVPHARHVEGGVRAGAVKIGAAMINELAAWASRKGIGGDNPRRAAWAIAISMASSYTSRGVVREGGGKGIFGQGMRVLDKLEAVLPKIVREEVAFEVERALG